MVHLGRSQLRHEDDGVVKWIRKDHLTDALEDELLREEGFTCDVFFDHSSHLFVEFLFLLFLLFVFFFLFISDDLAFCELLNYLSIVIFVLVFIAVRFVMEFIWIINLIELAWFLTSFLQPDFFTILFVSPFCFGVISPSQ